MASIRKHELEVLVGLVALVVLYFAGQHLLAFRDARNSYLDQLQTQYQVEAEASQYNIDALTAQRDQLKAAANADVFPTSSQVEQGVSTIIGLLQDPSINLGPVVMGEVSDQVTDADIGVSGSGVRSHPGVEMSLTLHGNVRDLLNLSQRILAAVPIATYRDVGVTLGTNGAPDTLSLRVLLYYRASEAPKTSGAPTS